jgi:hypothetical protein
MPRVEHSLVFESFGVIAEVVSDDRRLFESVPEVLPPGWRPRSGRAIARFGLMRDGSITLDGAEVVRTEADRSVLLVRLGSVVRHHLAVHSPGHVFVHAGVVSAGETAIVIPGSSHSGKTTLVTELVRAGAMYHSDEYAVVDPEGMIQPYAKPLSVRRAGHHWSGALVPVPEAQIARRPIRAGLIVLTRYEAGASWRPTALTGGEGAFALLAHTAVARSRPGQALAAVCELARGARVISGTRGEASAMAHALLAEQVPPGLDRVGPPRSFAARGRPAAAGPL